MPSPGFPPPGPLALLDIGSAKIACAILQPGTPGEVLAVVSTSSDGILAGAVRDPKAAHGAIVRAICDAEREAGVHARAARVAVSAGAPRVERITADLVLDPPVVTIDRADALASSLITHLQRGNRLAIHTELGPWRLDGRIHTDAPIERFGRELTLDVTAITVDSAPLRRLLDLVEAADLPVQVVLPAGLCGGLAVTTEQERDAGVAVVDVGASHTTVTTFVGGCATAHVTVAIGTHHLVTDWAEKNNVSFRNAERIIWGHGISALAHAASTNVPPHGADGVNTADSSSRFTATEVSSVGLDVRAASFPAASPRLELLFRLVADRFDDPDARLRPSARIILTGGGSLIPDLAHHAGHVWSRDVRTLGTPTFTGVLGRPDMTVLAGLALTTNAPAWGLVLNHTVQSRRVA